MNRLGLHFICKDESHVVERMLDSCKTIVDFVVAVDTGSTDGTQEIIKKWGEKNKVKTFVFDRAFDNFENSRNHARLKGIECAEELGYDLDKTWLFWFDCDEILKVEGFDKKKLDKDLLMINTRIGAMKYTRNTFIRCTKNIEWYGPVHEFLSPKEQITSGLAEGIWVDVKMEGASWKGDISQKYKSHAFVLEKYIDENRQDPRWIFYTAQSYHDSATSQNKEENEERLRRAIKYYKERISRTDGYEEERYYSQFRVGSIMRILEEPWSDTMQALLKAYAMDPVRGESIKTIIDHYLQVGEYSMAYMYSKFAKVNFHGRNPYPSKLLFVDEALYNWKFLEVHCATCFYTGRKEEAKESFKELKELTKKNPSLFTQEDINKIMSNEQFFK